MRMTAAVVDVTVKKTTKKRVQGDTEDEEAVAEDGEGASEEDGETEPADAA